MSARPLLRAASRPAVGAAALLAALVAAAPGLAQFHVNGRLLSPAETAWLEDYACGPVAPGSYWVDAATGYWGFAGSGEVMGHIRDRCSQRPPSLDERGQLYSPNEVFRDGLIENDPTEGSDWGGPRQPVE